MMTSSYFGACGPAQVVYTLTGQRSPSPYYDRISNDDLLDGHSGFCHGRHLRDQGDSRTVLCNSTDRGSAHTGGHIVKLVSFIYHVIAVVLTASSLQSKWLR